MVRFFVAWLRVVFDVNEERLRIRLYLHEGLDLDAAIAFWCEVIGVRPEQFYKPYRAVADSTLRSNRHPHGCVGVALHDSKVHRRIMGLARALLTSQGPDPG